MPCFFLASSTRNASIISAQGKKSLFRGPCLRQRRLFLSINFRDCCTGARTGGNKAVGTCRGWVAVHTCSFFHSFGGGDVVGTVSKMISLVECQSELYLVLVNITLQADSFRYLYSVQAFGLTSHTACRWAWTGRQGWVGGGVVQFSTSIKPCLRLFGTPCHEALWYSVDGWTSGTP